jgi:hypothetical protein
MPHPTKLAQVVVTEADPRSWFSRLVRRVTGSPWTHAFIVTGEDELTEAWFPRVRRFSVAERMAELAEHSRRHVVLELPEITDEERGAVAAKARSYAGRNYDVGQVLLYYLFRRFWKDGEGTLICSRVVTAAHFSGLGTARGNLFPPEHLENLSEEMRHRVDNLREGYATPVDLLHSRLARVAVVEPVEEIGTRGDSGVPGSPSPV